MKPHFAAIIGLVAILLIAISCSTKKPAIEIETDSVEPGSKVTRKGVELSLTGNPIEIGKPLPDTMLVKSENMSDVNLSDRKGKVLFLSIVPSIDTKVCEAQTHYLGEEGDRLPAVIERITVSRDTPFAQMRFAEEAKLTDILYLSDYKEGAFGRSTGLLLEGPRLLARSVILVDKNGIVRYIQVVPELTHLPDMEKAFEEAIKLANK